jgi:hypothetical protein
MYIFALYKVEIIFMKTPSEGTKKEPLIWQTEAIKAKRRAENARRAKEAAELLFPGEEWKQVEDGIYLSPGRPVGKKSNFQDEKRDAQILRNMGSIVYLVPENSRQTGKKYDAIVDGLKYEFKNVAGNANTLEMQFLRSRSQAPNVFINLEKSRLSGREIMSALYGARNKLETAKSRGYAHYNEFQGGRIILKIREQANLIFLNVDDLILQNPSK